MNETPPPRAMYPATLPTGKYSEIPENSSASKEFISFCQSIHICYYISTTGLQDFAKDLKKRRPNPERTMYFGKGHPNDGNYHAKINMRELSKSVQKDGSYYDALAKSQIVLIFASWDEHYRTLIAQENNCGNAQITSDLMGDIRLIRNCIIHNKSIITSEPKRMKVLSWKLEPGPLFVTDDMFQSLIEHINGITINYQEIETP